MIRAPESLVQPEALDDATLMRLVSEFADRCQTSESLAEIEKDLAKRLANFGILHFVHVETQDKNRRPSGALMAGPTNKEWRKLYDVEKWYPKDELIRNSHLTVEPVTWAKYQTDRKVSRGMKKIFDTAREFKFNDGYFLPIHRLDGSVNCVSFFSEAPLATQGGSAMALHLLSLYYSFAVRRLAETRVSDVKSRIELTERQRECLQWARAGKSNWEIGQILGISQFTVVEHIEEARKRLGVRTRTQAVIEAVSLGLIQL